MKKRRYTTEYNVSDDETQMMITSAFFDVTSQTNRQRTDQEDSYDTHASCI